MEQPNHYKQVTGSKEEAMTKKSMMQTNNNRQKTNFAHYDYDYEHGKQVQTH